MTEFQDFNGPLEAGKLPDVPKMELEDAARKYAERVSDDDPAAEHKRSIAVFAAFKAGAAFMKRQLKETT